MLRVLKGVVGKAADRIGEGKSSSQQQLSKLGSNTREFKSLWDCQKQKAAESWMGHSLAERWRSLSNLNYISSCPSVSLSSTWPSTGPPAASVLVVIMVCHRNCYSSNWSWRQGMCLILCLYSQCQQQCLSPSRSSKRTEWMKSKVKLRT